VNSCMHHNLDEREFALSVIWWTVKCFGNQNGSAARQVCASPIVKRGCENWKRGKQAVAKRRGGNEQMHPWEGNSCWLLGQEPYHY